MNPAQEAVELIWDELKDRSGFDAVIGDLDPVTRRDIKKRLLRIVGRAIQESAMMPPGT